MDTEPYYKNGKQYEARDEVSCTAACGSSIAT